VRWRIYYVGGETFCDEQGSPFDAPTLGVQVVLVAEPEVGRMLIAMRDYYWWDVARSTWFGGDVAGFYQYLMFDKGPKAVLFGRFVTNEEFQSCVKRAMFDPDFPPKSGKHPTEGWLP
jgi:hypothetical protein